MSVSRVKRSKQVRRLEARILGWEKTIKGLPATVNPKAFRKPGSNKK